MKKDPDLAVMTKTIKPKFNILITNLNFEKSLTQNLGFGIGICYSLTEFYDFYANKKYLIKNGNFTRT